MRAAAIAHAVGDLVQVKLAVFHQFLYLFYFLHDDKMLDGHILRIGKQAAQVGVVLV